MCYVSDCMPCTFLGPSCGIWVAVVVVHIMTCCVVLAERCPFFALLLRLSARYKQITDGQDLTPPCIVNQLIISTKMGYCDYCNQGGAAQVLALLQGQTIHLVAVPRSNTPNGKPHPIRGPIREFRKRKVKSINFDLSTCVDFQAT